MNNEFKKVHYKEVILTKDSPRLPLSVQEIAKKHIDNEKVFEALLPYYIMNEDLGSLINSMATMGWFPTEAANCFQLSDNMYKMVDGQRRLMALWLLHNSDNPLCPPHFREAIKAFDKEKIKEFDYVYLITL